MLEGSRIWTGNARISGRSVDAGAYEVQFTDPAMKGYPQAAFGSTGVQLAHRGCVPVCLDSGEDLKEAVVTFQVPLVLLSAVPVAPEIESATILGEPVLRLTARPGQVLRGPSTWRICASRFRAEDRRLSCRWRWCRVRGLRPDGVAVNNTQTAGASGRVVAVGEEPLLK